MYIAAAAAQAQEVGQGISTMVGMIGGAVLGNKIEGKGTPPPPQTTCTTQTVFENRLIGYNVVYVPTPVYRSYPPVLTSVNFGWGWDGGHRHGHWR